MASSRACAKGSASPSRSTAGAAVSSSRIGPRGRRVCVIEDRAASRFHRVGLEEYRLLRSLDGTRTVAMLLGQLARAGERETWSEAEAAQILRWARDQHLLAVESGRATPEREHTERALRAAATWLNP